MSVSSKQFDEVYARWCGWLDRVYEDVIWVHHHQQIWRAMRDVLLTSVDGDGGHFLQHYTRLYVDGMAMGVRRLTDPARDGKAVSLHRLISDIARMPEVITFDRYRSLFERPDQGYWPDEWEQVALGAWRSDFADADGDLSIKRLHEDLAILVGQSSGVTKFADRTIAHLDRRKAVNIPTFDDLDLAVETIGATFQRYERLLKAKSWFTLTPDMNGDWRSPFRGPLFPPP